MVITYNFYLDVFAVDCIVSTHVIQQLTCYFVTCAWDVCVRMLTVLFVRR